MHKLPAKLEKKFYTRNATVVARELLGKLFVRKIGHNYLVGKIVETEAYDGAIDQAAHSYSGITQRNSVMFEEGGLLYVYFTYGMHFCANAVCGTKGQGQAVLLRALEPVDGSSIMAINRFGKHSITGKEHRNLTNGPAKICSAFNIKREENGTNLSGNEIFITAGEDIPESSIIVTARIGIKKSVDLPWRFFIKDNPFASKP